jgi:hypothetical protein
MDFLARFTAAFLALAPGHKPSDCPKAWCGCWLRHDKGISDPSLNLAREWVHWGRDAHGSHVGAVVVWRHHVGKIVSGDCPAGEAMVQSGNDDHVVQTRCRSVRGAIAFRE